MKKIKISEVQQYKIKVTIFILSIFMLLFLGLILIKKSFSSYVSDSDINLNIASAVYVFEEDLQTFTLNLGGMIPSDEPYVYQFSIANYTTEKRSDVNIEYTISALATTNLPLSYELYRNENYDDPGAVDIITSNEIVSDSDSTWYRKIDVSTVYNMYFNSNTSDIYYLVVYFPKVYSETISFQGVIENIEVSVNSKQIVG